MKKKVFIAAAVVGALLLSWVGVITISVLVVQSRVPVTLPIQHDPVSAFGDLVRAKGTWAIDDQPQANPLQTTDISCWKRYATCFSATAELYGSDPTMTLFVEYFDVVHWSDTQVVFRNAAPVCVEYTYTIDLPSKAVNAVRTIKAGAEKDADCAVLEKELRLSLKNGFKISQKLRHEALPWFGRIAFAPLQLLQ